MFDLPWELNQLIVDNLYDDRPSLLACCLVSKAAIPLARRHLFHQASLEFTGKKSLKWNNMHKFMQSGTRPGHYVRVLLLRGVTYPWFFSTINQLSNMFPMLRELRFENVNWIRTFSPPRPLAGQSVWKSVTRLIFIGAYWSLFEDVQAFVSCFSLCEYMHMELVTVGVESFSRAGGRLPPFRSLELKQVPKLPILEWIMASPSECRLTSLILHNLQPRECEVARQFLRFLGNKLLHLEIGFRTVAGVEEAAGNLPSLRVLFRLYAFR